MPDSLSLNDFKINFKYMFPHKNDKIILVPNMARKLDGNWANQLYNIEDIFKYIEISYESKTSLPYGTLYKINTFNEKKIIETNYAGDEQIKDFKYTLIEVDSINNCHVPFDIQYSYIKSLKIPYSMITSSGKKSLHVIVPLYAKSLKDYREKQNMLYDICYANGLTIDKACKNPSRESRLPFTFRDGNEQKLIDIARNSEYKSYDEWFNLFANNYIMKNEWDESKLFKISEICKPDLKDVFYYAGKYYYQLASMPAEDNVQIIDRYTLLQEIRKRLKDPLKIKEILRQYDIKQLTLDMIDIPNKVPMFKITMEDDKSIKNLYKPGFIKEIYNNPRPEIKTCPSEWQKLLDNLAGKREQQWLINHLSYYFNTFKNPETIPVLYSAAGTGKDTFAECIGECIGGFASIDANRLLDSFNEFMLNGCILFNEASCTGKDVRMISNKLKLLTNQFIDVNVKCKAHVNVYNNSYKFFASNNDSIYAALKIEEGDRRYSFIGNGKNLNALQNHVTNYELLMKQKIEFCYFLKNYDYSEYEARRPLDNDLKQEQVLMGKSDEEQAIIEFKNSAEVGKKYDNQEVLIYLQNWGLDLNKMNNIRLGRLLKLHGFKRSKTTYGKTRYYLDSNN